MLSCHQATRLASDAQERPLSFKEKVSLKIHTIMCSGCRNFESSMNTLRKAMQGFASGDNKDITNNNTKKDDEKT
ncbi:MAG: zf-HC2 domain-containing protein [Pseudomonadales bacterium]|nr:zf-HC2 domain-containing protein [Pseudomonadales bacterium]